MTTTASDKILRDVINILQAPNAWRQLACAFANGDPYHAQIDGPDTDGWCIHGAIAKAARAITSNARDAAKLEQSVMNRIKTHMGWHSDCEVHSFNDDDSRSLGDVIGMLRGVLARTPALA